MRSSYETPRERRPTAEEILAVLKEGLTNFEHIRDNFDMSMVTLEDVKRNGHDPEGERK